MLTLSLRPFREFRTVSLRDLVELGRTSGPLVLAIVGNQLLGVVDTAIVGRVGTQPLAAVALGNGVYFTVTVIAFGCLLGSDPLLSQAIGAGEGERARAIVRAATRLAALLFLPAALVTALLTRASGVFGIEASTVGLAFEFVVGRLPGILPFLLLAPYRSLLQSRAIGRPLVVSAIVANVVNLFGNLLLIFGDRALDRIGLPGIGLPALGVLGSGIASSLASWAQLVVILVSVRALAPLAGGGATDVTTRTIVGVGLPVGLTLLAEVGAFSISSAVAASISDVSAASHQVALSAASFTFTFALGLSSATSVNVGKAIGRGDTRAARQAGIVGAVAVFLVMGTFALCFLLFATPLARIFTDSSEVVGRAAALLFVAAAFQLSDGAQCVFSAALRGLGDTRYSQRANVVGYYVIGLPLALLLAKWAGLAERGLFWGLSLGLTVIAVALARRFLAVTAGEVGRLR